MPAPGPPAVARRAADALLWFTAASIPLSISGMQVGVAGLAVLAVAGAAAGWGVARRTSLDAVLALFFGTLAVSTLASGHPLEAAGWRRPWVAIAYFAVGWWLRDRAHAARFVRVVVWAGALVGAYGILQHFTGVDWYRTLLGRVTVVRPREAGASGYAVVGFFSSYLSFGHTMVFVLAWAAALMMRGLVAGIVAAPLLVIAIALSTSRGAWLATLAAGLALAFAGRGLGGRLAGPRVAAALLAAGIAAVLVVPDLRAQVRGMFDTGGANAGRVAIYRANLDIVHDHPVLGLGFGRYRHAAEPYYAAYPGADRRSHAHSNYLQVAAEAGLLGLAAFALLYASALRAGWAALGAAPDAATWAAAAGAWAGLVGFLVGGVTQYTFGDNEVALTMWVALAILVRSADEAREGGRARGP